jgi:hypothetical protein
MMKTFTRWASTFSVLAMSLFLWSCDNAPGAIQPELEPSALVVTSTAGKRYVVGWEANAVAQTTSATIGSSGGILRLGSHVLIVSPNAVSAPTKFTMTRSAESPLRVKLTAGRESENDVGARGFDAPVRLALFYANAAQLPADRSSIEVIYFRPDGLVEEMTSQLDVYGNFAVATLPHFSLFGLAWP